MNEKIKALIKSIPTHNWSPNGMVMNTSVIGEYIYTSSIERIIERIIDIKQIQEDSYASAFRRFPKSTPGEVIQKMYEELHELEDAYLEECKDPYRKHASPHCPELTSIEEEVADFLMAGLVFAKLEAVDIEKCLRIKNEFNKTRI
jgi:NTP pyrophosphatase (non-canonical NTP hydrolase)